MSLTTSISGNFKLISRNSETCCNVLLTFRTKNSSRSRPYEDPRVVNSGRDQSGLASKRELSAKASSLPTTSYQLTPVQFESTVSRAAKKTPTPVKLEQRSKRFNILSLSFRNMLSVLLPLRVVITIRVGQNSIVLHGPGSILL